MELLQKHTTLVASTSGRILISSRPLSQLSIDSLGRPEGADLDLITYVTDRLGHDARYAIDSTKFQKELGWEPSLQFEEGIEKTVKSGT